MSESPTSTACQETEPRRNPCEASPTGFQFVFRGCNLVFSSYPTSLFPSSYFFFRAITEHLCVRACVWGFHRMCERVGIKCGKSEVEAVGEEAFLTCFLCGSLSFSLWLMSTCVQAVNSGILVANNTDGKWKWKKISLFALPRLLSFPHYFLGEHHFYHYIISLLQAWNSQVGKGIICAFD